jgi:Trypsin-like peptidase domain
MFSQAYTVARKFTFPIIISSRNHKDECSAGIGTFIVVNDEGWFITAHHIIKLIQQYSESNKEYIEIRIKREEIENDADLKKHIKLQQLAKLKIPPSAIKNFSVFLGFTQFKLGLVHILPEVDLAVGKIENFDKSLISAYPKFKDPSKTMSQGTSLCKLGFPFHSITPTFDEGKGFTLPKGSFPIPIFPIDGIYTRTINIEPQTPRSYGLKFIETSTPGLKGQSGGPTFDTNGTIWAIQSQTQHLKLGFGDNQKGSKEVEHLRNQYLNVGWGTHSETVTSFLTEHKIAFELDSL